MSASTIRIEVEAGVATLTLTRAARHNAMNAEMIAELTDAARRLGEDRSVVAVVLTGEGASFSAGADLSWMRSQFDATRETRIEAAMTLARMLKALNELPKPLIGRINGQAFGGGLGLIAVCDVAVAVDTARFAFTEVRLGLIPATISPYALRRTGEANARRVFFSGRAFDANEAVTLGLVARTASAIELDAAVDREIAPYRGVDAGAVALAKRLVLSNTASLDETALRRTAEQLADCWERPATHAAIAAFLSKTGG
ncbi:enoyl-CoA hydratase-related protein [Aureimonas sp. AU12]|uniref:enoyl-CoA hydratase-related protein n=1 Tax=Aureimonas sp. AU12 TaxID=1638161 RepID=UPI0007855D17|nr:enoyl-CoA hydratase-related protein [Aureimonas sp. AU12]